MLYAITKLLYEKLTLYDLSKLLFEKDYALRHIEVSFQSNFAHRWVWICAMDTNAKRITIAQNHIHFQNKLTASIKGTVGKIVSIYKQCYLRLICQAITERRMTEHSHSTLGLFGIQPFYLLSFYV
jgi:hypothetical protein